MCDCNQSFSMSNLYVFCRFLTYKEKVHFVNVPINKETGFVIRTVLNFIKPFLRAYINIGLLIIK